MESLPLLQPPLRRESETGTKIQRRRKPGAATSKTAVAGTVQTGRGEKRKSGERGQRMGEGLQGEPSAERGAHMLQAGKQMDLHIIAHKRPHSFILKKNKHITEKKIITPHIYIYIYVFINIGLYIPYMSTYT